MKDERSAYRVIHNRRLYEQVVEQIRDRVLSGELEDGDQLPTERELTEQLGVSRTVVREAMKALRQEGLVEVRPGRGTFISCDTSRAVKRLLDLMMRIDRGSDWSHVIEIREILEPEIAALAARRGTEKQIMAMREAVAAMDAALDDADAFVTADDDFHLAMAKGTQNPLLVAFIDSIVDLLHQQRARIFLLPGGPEGGQYHHKCVLNAIVRRDAEAARAAMCAHCEFVRTAMQKSP